MTQNGEKRGTRAARKRAVRKPRLMQRRSLRATSTAGWSWDVTTGAAAYSREWYDILAFPPGRRHADTLEVLFARMRREDREILEKQCAEIAAGQRN